MNRIAVVCALLAPICLPDPSAAQGSYLGLAPMRITIEAWTGGDQLGLLAVADRSVPLVYFLPNVSDDSRLDALGVGIGVRGERDRPEFAWRIEPLSVLIAKSPWMGGLTLLRYDRSGVDRLRADWFAVHAGPALGTEGPVQARLKATAALATLAPGGVVFDRLPTAASTGGLASAEALVRWKPAGGIAVASAAGALRVVGGEHPVRMWASASATWRPDARWAVGAGFRIESASLGGLSQERSTLSLSLRFTPRAVPD